MKVEIRSFADAGVAEKERVVLKVAADGDIGKYLLLYSSKTKDSAPTGGRKLAYWFPDKAIKSGDLVVLYTKKGTKSEKALDNGTTVHFFYWGLDAPIWGDDKNVAVLMYSNEWTSSEPARKEA
ncbi:hypothetical protein WL27_01875 [Burkholderia multivorans]|uniref:hypothetical protein n=1 Tax=Burkholderia multivorans TaxID=87883 RepID=UPI00075B13FD|nr:hypothetical protein [Burkholderia multivorans]KWA42180.1 hypothetical protein WL27_01875 [Burkholderia multivorans]